MTKSARKGIEVSSDAAARLQTARNWVLAYPADTEILIIANSTEAASDFQLGVLSASGAWFGIKRLTLNVLAMCFSSMVHEKGSALAVTPATHACRASHLTRQLSDLMERTLHILGCLIDEVFKSIPSKIPEIPTSVGVPERPYEVTQPVFLADDPEGGRFRHELNLQKECSLAHSKCWPSFVVNFFVQAAILNDVMSL
jgi:hypothetical protein